MVGMRSTDRWRLSRRRQKVEREHVDHSALDMVKAEFSVVEGRDEVLARISNAAMNGPAIGGRRVLPSG